MASSHEDGTVDRTLCPFCQQRAVNFACKHCGAQIMYVLHAECQACGKEDGGKIGGKCEKCGTLQKYILDVWKKDNEYIWLKMTGSSIVASMRGNFLTKNPFIQEKISTPPKADVVMSSGQVSSPRLSLRDRIRGLNSHSRPFDSNLLDLQRPETTIPPFSSTIPSPASACVVLGKDIDTRQSVTLEQEARLRGLYVIGITGSGKTTLLQNLILQDIEQGMGVCFFDTHGDAINDILARLPSSTLYIVSSVTDSPGKAIEGQTGD